LLVEGGTDTTAEVLDVLLAVLGDVRAGRTHSPTSTDHDADQTTVLLEALVLLRGLREQIATWEPELITAARAAGASWVQLAPALGVTSRQAAERRYLRLRPTETGETTGEGRVQAARGQRAGDRAVTDWARANAATLRQLAGQVSALPNLTPDARHQADQIRAALAGDDAAALLTPLGDLPTLLGAELSALAERITAVTSDAEHQRQTTLDQRHTP
jgi:hypothetical protein